MAIRLTNFGVCRLLVLCAHLAAGLPYRRADEPHTVVFHINTLVSRRGEDVLSALKASLADSLPKSKSPDQKTPQVLHRALHNSAPLAFALNVSSL